MYMIDMTEDWFTAKKEGIVGQIKIRCMIIWFRKKNEVIFISIKFYFHSYLKMSSLIILNMYDKKNVSPVTRGTLKLQNKFPKP